MKLFKRMIAGVLLLTSGLAMAATPIEDLNNVAVPTKIDGTVLTFEEVRNAIVRGCKDRGWKPELVSEGVIKASILVRNRHQAEVRIPFDSKSYSIQYVKSDNLDYDAEDHTIHRNYNKWVVYLSQSIQKEFDI
ncbi:hypothetical protein L9G74_13190 [Shewanella sp. C32]|uniref:Lipoprotein n=1 Tax=Shewanella electrica TaxID=515560 RepID=A0ABT2FP40_9GAMM|nr:hypothetical protein [Shewanella electrica]MCH1925993.1 hypothetical protein [Shewanella electrica]MCS4557400.1 hypothetical protein [Shewanella electrica]